MYFFYIDESGSPNGWGDQNHFVLGGVAIHEGQVRPLTESLNGIQKKYFPDITIQIPFHAGDMKSGDKRWRDVGEETREKMLLEVYDVMSNAVYPNLVTFGVALHISKAVDSEAGNLRTAFQDICLRFNTFNVRQHKLGATNKGLLIIDNAHQNHYKDLINEFRQFGVKGAYIGNIVDIPYFAPSKDTRMLQLADFCSYAVFRYYDRNDDEYLKRILCRFDRRDRFHEPDGLKHITKNQSCDCIDCSWRRSEKTHPQPKLTPEPEDVVQPFRRR